ncbi:DUF3050 domain-containing protein [Deminuibacter soli]|uniref:DUF3050 domain-containing protein n=1 Tax=Deminuibacter soli TaxID=2291815 RepID=A0A3E1NR48_9BACT|nr:DUF3050 domain-containing protein [Deminuibacter soli]RFM30294.1 DUF3050 domain-containing protein [Deminuibacter soli]
MHQSNINQLKQTLQPVRDTLVAHPLYTRLHSLQHIQTFTQFHVYAVWDFMSLLKSLQQQLTCVRVPWVPAGSGNTRYLINEIVLGEESDIDANGVRQSHFELYLSAMQQLGADTSAINNLLAQLAAGQTIQQAIQQNGLPQGVVDFVHFTFQIIENTPAHVQAAVFTFGREDLIPDMFLGMVKELSETFPQLAIFRYYLERHIEVDGDHHSHLAMEMVSELCGTDTQKWVEATQASLQALESRKKLWDAVLAAVEEHQPEVKA